MAGEFDMGRMQEEAIRRAREMQSRARIPRPAPRQRADTDERSPSREQEQHAGQEQAASGMPEQTDTQEERQPAQAETPPRNEVPVPHSAGISAQHDNPITNIFDTLLKDKERTIILSLLILLSGEDGNHELLFALLFLLM